MPHAAWNLGALILASGVSSALLTYCLVRLDSRLRLTAVPRENRWHRRATPNSGGVAVFLSCALVYGVAFLGTYPAVAAGAAAIFVLGFLDDRFGLSPFLKLAGQCVIAALVVHSGVIFPASPWLWLNEVFSFLWIVGLTNSFNLIDNMDGLCAGVTVIIATFRIFTLGLGGHTADAGLAAIVAASFAGFLIFNHHPARIFMGDCGSMLAGFTLSALTIASSEAYTKAFAAGFFYPALTFMYPIFDTLLVSMLRRSAGRPISVGGRDHSSHRLVYAGIGERRAVWILWGLAGLGSAMGLLTRWIPLEVMAAAALLVAALSMFGIFLGTLPPYQVPADSPALASSLRRHIPTLRAGVILLVDTLVAGNTLFIALLVHYPSGATPFQIRPVILSMVVFMASHGLVSYLQRTFDMSWRWFSVKDSFSIGRTVAIGAAVGWAGMLILGVRYPLDVLLLYYGGCFALSVGLRGTLGALQDLFLRSPSSSREKMGIFGVSAEAKMAAALLKHNAMLNAVPVVFLDYDHSKEGMRIDGIPVRCCADNLRELAAHFGLQSVVIAGPYDHRRHAALTRECLEAGLRPRTLEITIRDLDSAQPLAASAGA